MHNQIFKSENYFYFIALCCVLLNSFLFKNKICSGMLMSNQKMSDICWGDENIDVDPQNIPLLLYYFRSCLQATELLETSDKQSLLETLSSRIDSVLPEIKFAYFNGNIGYDIIENMNDLVNEINLIESSYVEPQSHSYNPGYDYGLGEADDINGRAYRSLTLFKWAPLKLTASLEDQKQACNSLILLKINVNGNKSGICSRNNLESKSKYSDDSKFIIPVPVLHNVGPSPRSIAVPLKQRAIYPINGKESKDVLVRYYITAIQCLYFLKQRSTHNIPEFNERFCNWIEKEVMPHVLLHEYYPAFIGTHQILKTMESKGMAQDCVDRINKRESYLLKKNRLKSGSIMSNYMDNSTKVIKSKTNGNGSLFTDYENTLQTMKPIKIKYNSEQIKDNKVKKQGNNTCFLLSAWTSSLFSMSVMDIMVIIAFLISVLLATWAVAGSLCFGYFHKHDESCEKRCLNSQSNLYGGRGGIGGGSGGGGGGGGGGAGGGGGGCPYEPGESVIIMMKDETGNPQYYYGTFHLDKNKISDKGFPYQCESEICVQELCSDMCKAPCAKKTQSDNKLVTKADNCRAGSYSCPEAERESPVPDKSSTGKTVSEESGSSKAQIGSSCPGSQHCPCPCSTGGPHYGLCQHTPALPQPLSHNSLLLNENFFPQKSATQSISESVTSSPSYDSKSVMSEETDAVESITSQSSSRPDSTETNLSTTSASGQQSPPGEPLQTSQPKPREIRKKEISSKPRLSSENQKPKPNKTKGKK